MNRKKFTFLPQSIIVALFLVAVSVNVIKSCPLVCTCKWKGGKRKVECSNKNLTSLISNIDSETQVLDYSRNHLHFLSGRIFEELNLINLQKLYLSECQLSRIHDSAFHALSNLIELDLANNMLTNVPSPNFKDLPLLMKLTLSSNPIRVLESSEFSTLKYLTTLDLSDCQIESIEKEAFKGVPKLDWLKLEGNKLKNFKFANSIPQVTSGLSLHRNLWKCDCHLRPFHQWLMQMRRIIAPITVDPVCEEPASHRGTLISQLQMNDLACAPWIIPSSFFVEINEGKNISFVCQVSAVPEAQITWDFEGHPVSSNSSFVYPFYKYYAEEATTEQVSELFVNEAKKENNGTYRCTAENVAGISTSNYTLKVVSVKKEQDQLTTAYHVHILVTSISLLLVATLIIVLFVSCSLYSYKNKKPPVTKSQDARIGNGKTEVEYQIIKQQAATVAASPSKTDRNPDLIINTENKVESCEHLLLLPGDIKQTYLTLTGNTTLVNTRLYEGVTYKEDSQINLLNPNVAAITAAATPAGIINLYLSPSTQGALHHNLYMNPFDNYVDSVEQKCWTLRVANEDASSSKEKHVLLDCCNQAMYQENETSPPNSDNRTSNDGVNLRHNLEGYPFPSKLKLTTINLDYQSEQQKSPSNTPILSPPDPFKTDINKIGLSVKGKKTESSL